MKYLGKDQDWDEETTTYWFDVDGSRFGVVESGVFEPKIVDVLGGGVNLDSPFNMHLSSLPGLVTDEMRMD